MSNHEPKVVSASEKPWMNHEEPFVKTFYPMSWGKSNSYAIFSPGIDRFLVVDTYDPWMLYETGKVLSSKVSTMVYILDQITPHMTNETCLNFSTLHKKNETGYGSPMIASHRQSASLSKITKDMVVDVGWPVDFTTDDRKNMLLKLQEYTMFSLRVIYAITISVNFRNFFPEKEYLDVFFQNQFPQDFKIHYDTTTADQGMISLIKTILYESDSTESALTSIAEAWLVHSKNDPSGTRQLFYRILEIEQPSKLAELGLPGFVKNRNDQTMWVV
jgi:hypothetical protein